MAAGMFGLFNKDGRREAMLLTACQPLKACLLCESRPPLPCGLLSCSAIDASGGPQSSHPASCPITIGIRTDVDSLGAQWGDEGKGKLVDILAAEADICARCAGGNNAGHTIVVKDAKGEKKTYAFNLLPSGQCRASFSCKRH